MRYSISEIYRHTVFGKYFFLTTLLSFIQQVIVASSIIVFSIIMDDILEKKDLFYSITLLFFVVLLPYIPSAINQYLGEKWYVDIINRFINCIPTNNKSELKNKKAFLTNEVFRLSRDISFCLSDMINVLFSVIISCVFVVFFVKFEYIYIYTISFLLTYFVYKVTSNHIKKLSHENQYDRTKLVSCIDLWMESNLEEKEELCKAVIGYKKSNKSLAFTSVSYTNIGNIFCLLPILIFTSYTILNSSDYSEIALLSVLIPRQLQIINYIYVVISTGYELLRIERQYRNIVESLISFLNPWIPNAGRASGS